MRLAKAEDNKIIVTIKQASRDAKTDKIVYKTVESIDVFDAKGDEVLGVVQNALTKAASGK